MENRNNDDNNNNNNSEIPILSNSDGVGLIDLSAKRSTKEIRDFDLNIDFDLNTEPPLSPMLPINYSQVSANDCNMAMGGSEDFQQPLPHVPVQTPPLDFNSIPPEGHATYQDSHDQQVHVYNDAEILVNSTTLTNNAKNKGKMPMSYSEEACAQVDAESFWKKFQPARVLQSITNDKTKTLRLFGIDIIQEGVVGVTDESPSERKRKGPILERYLVPPRYNRIYREAVKVESNLDLVDDGYNWRKYGRKAIKGNQFLRNYYRCTYSGCYAKKHVQRDDMDPRCVITTYEGSHNHEMPCTGDWSGITATAGTSSGDHASDPHAAAAPVAPFAFPAANPIAHQVPPPVPFAPQQYGTNIPDHMSFLRPMNLGAPNYSAYQVTNSFMNYNGNTNNNAMAYGSSSGLNNIPAGGYNAYVTPQAGFPMSPAAAFGINNPSSGGNFSELGGFNNYTTNNNNGSSSSNPFSSYRVPHNQE